MDLQDIRSMISNPIPAYRFYVILLDAVDPTKSPGTAAKQAREAGKQVVAGFSSCTGLQINTEIYEYKEGGLNSYVHKFVTNTSHSNIVLKRGITFTTDLWEWHQNVASGKIVRKNGAIIVQNDMGIPTAVWSFTNALPLRLSGPELDAIQSKTALETLELSHEGLERLAI